MIKKILLFLVVCLIFASCKKTKLVGDYAKYEGTWQSETTSLVLKSNGKADYDYSSGGLTKNITDGRLIISGSTLKIKFMISKTYNIDTPPTDQMDDYGNISTVMVLDGEYFYKY